MGSLLNFIDIAEPAHSEQEASDSIRRRAEVSLFADADWTNETKKQQDPEKA